MKIINIKVNNYRSLTNIDISGFDVINMIKGQNNSGKSNLLKFLEMVFRKKSYSTLVSTASDSQREELQLTDFWEGQIFDEPFMFKNNNRTSPIEFSIKVAMEKEEIKHFDKLVSAGIAIDDDTRTNIIVIEGKFIPINQSDSEIELVKVSIRDTEIYGIHNGVARYFENTDLSQFPSLNETAFLEILQELNDLVSFIDSDRFFSSESTNSEIVVLNPKTFKNWLFQLSLDSDKFEEYQKLIDFIGKIELSSNIREQIGNLKNIPFIDPRITFSKFGNELEVMLETENGRYPLKNYGTGIQQILFLISKVFNTKSRVILIEELELNLSNQFQELLINNFKLFADEGIFNQLIFTSHSDNLYRNDFRLFKVMMDESGNSSVQRITNENNAAVRTRIRETGNK